MSDMDTDQKIQRYLFPPVDPITGDVSAEDGAIRMGQMKHCDVPMPHRKGDCNDIMDHHGWIDNGTLLGTVVCPTYPGDPVCP